jgi:dUTP pyrophosphatase
LKTFLLQKIFSFKIVNKFMILKNEVDKIKIFILKDMTSYEITDVLQAYKTGSAVEQKVADEKIATAIFEKLGSSFKWSFIQGHLETHGKINSNELCVSLTSNMVGLLESIASFADIPFLLEGKTLIYDDINAVDFLGKVYSNHLIVQRKCYNLYLAILTGKPEIETCLVFKTCPEAIMPIKSRVSDVGYDLSVIRKVKALNKVVSLYDTGIKVRVPHGYYTEIVPRSSLSKSGYMMANSVGIIDRSYNGNLYVALAKIDGSSDDIKFPFRCCQLIFRKQYHMSLKETKEDLEATARGEGGFGSTG